MLATSISFIDSIISYLRNSISLVIYLYLLRILSMCKACTWFPNPGKTTKRIQRFTKYSYTRAERNNLFFYQLGLRTQGCDNPIRYPGCLRSTRLSIQPIQPDMHIFTLNRRTLLNLCLGKLYIRRITIYLDRVILVSDNIIVR